MTHIAQRTGLPLAAFVSAPQLALGLAIAMTGAVLAVGHIV